MVARVALSENELLVFTRRIAEELCDDATFEAVRSENEPRFSLMAGPPGIASFLAEVSRALGDRRALEGAERWLRLSRELKSRTASDHPSMKGLLRGPPGCLWASVLVADAAGDKARRRRALQAFVGASSSVPRTNDLTWGRAGFAEACRQLLATLEGLSPEEVVLLERVARNAEAIAFRHAQIEPHEATDLGVAHGLAGMLLVLLGSREHRAFATHRVERLARLRRRLTDGLAYFPMHHRRRPGRLPGSWCNGRSIRCRR